MQTTSYSFNCPAVLWSAFTDQIPRDRRIDDHLNQEVLAEYVLEVAGDDLDTQTARAIEQIASGEDPWG